ncbi:DUF305 domain-containing protein [Paraconexibacter algicola]|nr:DUF305 domain-containing protein [Paraconexibacter algicola]
MQSTFRRRRPLMLVFAIVAIFGALVVSGCGSDDEPTSSSSGNAVDLAFVQEMVTHHNSAVAMATVAQERTTRKEIKRLADDIVESQTAEIKQMQGIAKRLEADGVKAGELGVPEAMMGMSGDETMLEMADPFDREFIDMMVPHHQGAIVMARAVLKNGESAEVKELAQAIVTAQSREIGEMNSWRTTWYGAASPAGGVPEDTGETGGSMKDGGTEGSSGGHSM